MQNNVLVCSSKYLPFFPFPLFHDFPPKTKTPHRTPPPHAPRPKHKVTCHEAVETKAFRLELKDKIFLWCGSSTV